MTRPRAYARRQLLRLHRGHRPPVHPGSTADPMSASRAARRRCRTRSGGVGNGRATRQARSCDGVCEWRLWHATVPGPHLARRLADARPDRRVHQHPSGSGSRVVRVLRRRNAWTGGSAQTSDEQRLRQLLCRRDTGQLAGALAGLRPRRASRGQQAATEPGIGYNYFYYPPVFLLICGLLARLPSCGVRHLSGGHSRPVPAGGAPHRAAGAGGGAAGVPRGVLDDGNRPERLPDRRAVRRRDAAAGAPADPVRPAVRRALLQARSRPADPGRTRGGTPLAQLRSRGRRVDLPRPAVDRRLRLGDLARIPGCGGRFTPCTTAAVDLAGFTSPFGLLLVLGQDRWVAGLAQASLPWAARPRWCGSSGAEVRTSRCVPPCCLRRHRWLCRSSCSTT